MGMLSRRFKWVRKEPIETFEYICNSKCAGVYPSDSGYIGIPNNADHRMSSSYLRRILDVYDGRISTEQHNETCVLGKNPLRCDNKSAPECKGGTMPPSSA